MATTSVTSLDETHRRHSLSVTRLLASGGGTAAVAFILCWLGTYLPFGSPTHAYIPLFTNADIRSVQALAEGTLWSLLFGALVGGLFALVYNAMAFLDRR